MNKDVPFQSALIVKKSPAEAGGDDRVIAAVLCNTLCNDLSVTHTPKELAFTAMVILHLVFL